MTPYTTRSGVQIGRLYQPRQRAATDRDSERLQRALLNEFEPVDWSGLFIVAVCAVAALGLGVWL